MEALTSIILSGLIYDGVKEGATIGFSMLKSKLQGWLIDDTQIQFMAEQLKAAGVNEDLAPHAIERKINEHQGLVELLKQIRFSGETSNITQTSHVGHNINNNGSGNITVGNIEITRGEKSGRDRERFITNIKS